MSVLTRKPAVPFAQQVAQQAVPLARQAGTSVRQGADDAVARAAPLVDAARQWIAPQLEQSAYALSDSIAPMISSAMISAAQKIDTRPRHKPRRLRGILAGTAVLTAAASLAAVLVVRRRGDSDQQWSPLPVRPESDGDGAAAARPDGGEGGPDPNMDGGSPIV